MLGASILLLLIGYSLALPAVFKFASLKSLQHRFGRLWMITHQFGLLIAATGWIVRRQFLLAGLHILLAVGVRLFVEYQQRRQLEQPQPGHDG